VSKRLKNVAIAGFLLGAMSFNPWPAEATQHATDDSDRVVATSRGSLYQRCILHRESRNTNARPNSSGASGYYQFTHVAWDATVKRMGKARWAGRDPYTFTRKQQTMVYHAAWQQGSGKFYWSARWGAPYACFPGDVKGMKS
jgi:hypothetical protein